MFKTIERRSNWSLGPTFRYWMQTEVHVYALAIAASTLLSFYPFLLVISYVCYSAFGASATVETIKLVLNDYFLDDFVVRNLPVYYAGQPQLSILAIPLLLFTANGIFEPLEVALNRAWGIARNRSYVRNQVLSFGMIFLCGSLTLLSTLLTGYNSRTMLVYKLAAVPVSILNLFLIYWLLPNAKINWRGVLPPAIVVALAFEGFKYINLLTFPLWLNKFSREYGPFKYSALIVVWSFLGSLLILAGAEWAARRAAEGRGSDPVES